MSYAVLDEERFLKQKSKIDWLEVGDSNSKFFHNSVKAKQHSSRIERITDVHGIEFEGSGVANALVAHYEKFLGCSGPEIVFHSDGIFKNKLSMSKAQQMIEPVTDDEIKKAMFSIGDNKAPGPDGFSALFFKKSWDVVGKQVSLFMISSDLEEY